MSIRETIVVNPKYENFRPLLESLSHGDPTDERSSALLTHYVTEAEGVQVAIACFPRPSLWQRIVRLGRKSKARAAFDNALRLQTLGIATPEPIGYKETFGRGYFVARFIPDSNDMNGWTHRPNSSEAADRIGEFLAQLHKNGVMHKRMCPNDIIITATDKKCYIVNTERVVFGVRDRDRLMRNFRAINADNIGATTRLARHYAAFSPFRDLDAASIIDLAVNEQHKHLWRLSFFGKK